MSSLQEHNCLNIYYGNILLHFGLDGLKIHKTKKMFFFLPTTSTFAKQNNPLMQLCLIFHKALNKNKLNVLKFRIHRFSSFSACN